MKAWRIVSSLTLLVLLFIGCRGEHQGGGHDWLEGLWISTDETSWYSGPDTQRVVLLFQRDAQGALGVQGFFARNGDYQMEWELVDVQVDEVARRFTILDSDRDTLIGSEDSEGERITGSVHLLDGSVNSLNFVRSHDNRLALRLLYPRLPDADGNVTYTYRQPDQVGDGLRTSALPIGAPRTAVSRLVERIIIQEFGHIKSLLILQDGELVVEEYFFGYDREQLQRINSCTKSVASLLLGIALGNHPDVSTDRSLFSFFPRYDSLKTPEKEAITMEHALTMTAGLETEEAADEADDWLRALLSRPLRTKPGSTFKYDNGSTNLLCGVIQRLEGEDVPQYAEEFLFGPLGITEYQWEVYDNGMTECASGLELRPRDMAKIGLLVLNNGVWQGRQVVPAEWVRESTRPHVRESEYSDYGYQWWYRSRQNKPWWKEPEVGAANQPELFTALGAGGQFISIIRDLNLVVVTTASDYAEDDTWLRKIPMIVEEIVPALSKHG